MCGKSGALRASDILMLPRWLGPFSVLKRVSFAPGAVPFALRAMG
jgi:hypothetical protein